MDSADCEPIGRHRATGRLIPVSTCLWSSCRPGRRRGTTQPDRTRLGSGFRPFVLLSALLVWLAAAPAAAQVGGCEAEDMAALLAPTGTAHWEAPPRAVGPWLFSHAASIDCEGGNCRINAGLMVDHLALVTGLAGVTDGSMLRPARVGAPAVVLSPSPNAIQGRGEVRGAAARIMAASLGPSAFEDAEGWLRRVWLDYGRVAGMIRLRGRTEIACSPDEPLCSVGTMVIAYVSYDEHQHDCGYISRSRQISSGW